MINDKHNNYVREIEVSNCTTLGVLLIRDILNLWRNPLLMKSLIFQGIFLGTFIGGLYFDRGTKDYT